VKSSSKGLFLSDMIHPTLRKRLPLLLSILAGVLMWAAWPTSPLTFLVFIGLVPLLALTDMVKGRGVYWGLTFLSFWIWNTGTTWWVGNTTVPASGIFANAFNALIMTIPWLGYKIARERMGTAMSYFALIIYWLTFEYIHLEWDFSWPWLMLGNAFAMRPDWVQWYEYTGTPGGTLWVLLANILFYSVIKAKPSAAWKPLTLVIVPLAISYGLFPKPGKTNGIHIVVVQPNIDPYDEKFSEGSAQQQLEKFFTLTKQKIRPETRYVIWPETALFTQGAWEHELNLMPDVIQIREFLQQYPNTKIIAGASTFKQYTGTAEVPLTARTRADGGPPYDAFNSAIQIDTSGNIQVYHKAKLVPGVELTPYMRYFPFMKKLALDFGGISGSYGLTPGVNLFTDPARNCNVFDAICYESVYGDFVAQKVREGANILAISTNDGWWGNTQGHKQHLQYARLRAIETRRWVARSANTGTSAFIDPWGAVIDPQPYWQQGIIAHDVTPRYDLTFYVKYSSSIAKAPLIFCILLLSYTIVLRVIRRRHVEKNK